MNNKVAIELNFRVLKVLGYSLKTLIIRFRFFYLFKITMEGWPLMKQSSQTTLQAKPPGRTMLKDP